MLIVHNGNIATVLGAVNGRQYNGSLGRQRLKRMKTAMGDLLDIVVETYGSVNFLLEVYVCSKTKTSSALRCKFIFRNQSTEKGLKHIFSNSQKSDIQKQFVVGLRHIGICRLISVKKMSLDRFANVHVFDPNCCS
jgi:hypothetical protein